MTLDLYDPISDVGGSTIAETSRNIPAEEDDAPPGSRDIAYITRAVYITFPASYEDRSSLGSSLNSSLVEMAEDAHLQRSPLFDLYFTNDPDPEGRRAAGQVSELEANTIVADPQFNDEHFSRSAYRVKASDNSGANAIDGPENTSMYFFFKFF